MGKLDKKIISQFVDNECERQLFLNVGEGSDVWMNPVVKLVEASSHPRINRHAQKLGQQYENQVYAYLARLPICPSTITPNGTINHTWLTRDRLLLHAQNVKENSPLILLEQEFPVPIIFYNELFKETNYFLEYDKFHTKVSSKLRPDILILRKLNGKVKTLDKDNNVVKLNPTEVEKRIGINIYDIKASSKDSIDKKYFTEIIFYIYAFQSFLRENNLLDQFYINLEGNGIFPKHEGFFIAGLEEFFGFIAEMRWDETSRIFLNAIKVLQNLRNEAPLKKEKVPLNIKPACASCEYVNDCKQTLGYGTNIPKQDWDIRLIPYMTTSIAEQLNSSGVSTIGELLQNRDTLASSSTPNPIYPQLPLLTLKSTSLRQGARILPQEGSVKSVAIPTWNDMTLIFDVQQDPIHERVFGISFYARISVSKFRKAKERFNNFWLIWNEYLENNMPYSELEDLIKEYLPADIPERALKRIKDVMESLWKLNGTEYNYMKITNAGSKFNEDDEDDDARADNAIISIAYSAINQANEGRSEYSFMKSALKVLHAIVLLTDFMEIQFSDQYTHNDQIMIDRPILAVFYWSNEILEDLEKLMERHLETLVFDNDMRSDLMYLIQWFTPSESGVRDPNQHKKVFDLRLFAESIVAYPLVINYTWHEILKLHFDTNFSSKYWRPHYNYVDFKIWHEFLAEEDAIGKAKLLTELRRQLAIKVRNLNRLKGYYQQQKNLISKSSRPAYSDISRSQRLPNTFNYLAQIWYLFSRLTGMLDQHETLLIRNMYPEFSVGKLSSAKVSNLKEHKGSTDKRVYYTFTLEGYSSNVKLNEGDERLLVPLAIRDEGQRIKYWRVTIETMDWDATSQSYAVKTEENSNNILQKALDNFEITSNAEWYLFPISFDAWSSKINDLLTMFNLGRSWLGNKFVYEQSFLLSMKLEIPKKLEFTSQELYLYAPKLFEIFNGDISSEELKADLKLSPDQSQKEAILNSLSNTISLIQGPPGTGKSETITALIEEFLERTEHLDRPRRILITAFSYPAMRVILDKLRSHRNSSDNPTKSASIPKVFVRSSRQTAISNLGYKEGQPGFVNDLYRKGSERWALNRPDHVKRASSAFKDETLEQILSDDLLIFANAHSLYRLLERDKKGKRICLQDDFAFDLIIVDEASQLPTDYILASLAHIRQHTISVKFGVDLSGLKEVPDLDSSRTMQITSELDPNDLTKLIVVGDNNQLPPVQPVEPPKKLKMVLGSLFNYYVEGHDLSSTQLTTNYRSNQEIVDYTNTLEIYKELKAFELTANQTIDGKVPTDASEIVKEVMRSDRIVNAIIHDQKYDIAISQIEAQIVVEIIYRYYQMVNPQTEADQIKFWEEGVGVVAPHNAQGRIIIRDLFERISSLEGNLLNPTKLMVALKSTIYSVEKFQGSDRTLIVASVGISSIDQISAEEDFIYDLNRFNVLTSRAKAKIILVCSRNFLDYYPRDPQNVENAANIRHYAVEYCKNSLKIPFSFNSDITDLEYRWYSKQ